MIYAQKLRVDRIRVGDVILIRHSAGTFRITYVIVAHIRDEEAPSDLPGHEHAIILDCYYVVADFAGTPLVHIAPYHYARLNHGWATHERRHWHDDVVELCANPRQIKAIRRYGRGHFGEGT